MEKYLTPIQYQQYLHDKAYQSAMAATVPQVRFVFVVFALTVVVALTIALCVKVLRARKERKAETAKKVEERLAMSRQIEREIEEIERVKAFRYNCPKCGQRAA